MKQKNLIRDYGGSVFEDVTPGKPLSIGKFGSHGRAAVALKIYCHFLLLGFRNIPRTMTAIK